jgi:acyl-CoA thioester hydrolase
MKAQIVVTNSQKGYNSSMPTPQDPLKNRTAYRVIYGDTDQMGVAYYANYLRWFEMGRTEFLRQQRMPYSSIEQMGYRFPVTELSCRYHRPAHYDETIIIETRLVSTGRVALRFNYKLSREEDDLVIAEGWTRHACVNPEGRVTKIPSDLRLKLQAALSPDPAAPE